jgi:hypothetical protein
LRDNAEGQATVARAVERGWTIVRELGAGGRILAAYLDQQYPGQRWLPIDSRALQTFLAAAPTVAKDALGRQGLRRLWRSTPAYHVAA